MEQIYRNATVIENENRRISTLSPLFYMLSFITSFGLAIGEQINEYFSLASKIFIIFGFIYSILFLIFYKSKIKICDKSLIVLLAWITLIRLVRYIFSGNSFSLDGVLEEFKVPLFIMIAYVLFKSFAREERLLKVFLVGFLAGFVAMVPFGESSMYSTYLRTYGTYANPNTYAYDCILAVFAGIYLLKVSKKFQILKIFVIAIAAVMLFRTQSRGALLALILGLSTYFLLMRSNFKKLIILAGAFVLAGILLFVFRDTVSEVLTRYSPDEMSGNVRFEIWGAYLNNMDKFFWLGMPESQMKSIHYYTTHNNFLAFFVSYGIVGLVLFVVVNVKLFATFIKNRKTAKFDYKQMIGISLFITLTFSGLTHEAPLFRGFWISFMFTCFLLYFQPKQRKVDIYDKN